ncbi:unnamed protein product [Hydatigera taeniaeformis]|uniref:TAF6 C-terminal HEAT repeat domain-containing protein n=1 Tax=Hydatigena taeniaeformis TaxID=6205 RepID=A0A3P7GAA2_HYDTA|nr:unnamed protein product [Hydatigera taeniaeformis]
MNAINSNLAILIYLVRLTKALVDNPNVSLKAYLQNLVPGIITCSLCRQVCAKPITDNHWALRDFAAKQLVAICNKSGVAYRIVYYKVIHFCSSEVFGFKVVILLQFFLASYL